MSARLLMGERRVEVIDGRRFLVGEPTCATILKAIALYPEQIVILRREYLKGPEIPVAAWAHVAASMLTAKPAACAEVLATFCTLHGGAPGELEELAAGSSTIRERLTQSVIALCDPSAIAGAFGWEAIDAGIEGRSEAEPAGDDDGPSGMEILVTRVALEFSQDPRVVMGWPYEMVTRLYETLIPACRIDERVRAENDRVAAEFGVH